MNNLAAAYKDAGKLDRALPLYETTLRRMKARHGPDHPYTLNSRNNLAMGYQAAGKPDKALPLLEQTLEGYKARLGPDHPDVLTCMSNLARVCYDAGRLDRALPLYERALQLRQAKLGPEHPDTLLCANNLAMTYRAAGRPDRALPLLEKTLQVRKARLGPDHPDVIMSMNNLALIRLDAGKAAEALALFEEALRLAKARLGPEHPQTVRGQVVLAVVRRLRDSERRYQREKAAKGPRHVDALLALRDVAQMHLVLTRPDQAEPLLAEVLSGLADRAPDDDVRAFTVALLAGCLEQREKAQPNAWATFNTRSMLGGALLGQKKYDEAEPLLLKGYEGMKQREKTIPPQGKVRIAEALDRLIELYEATKKPELAKQYRAGRARYPDLLPPPLVEE
jgi:tetratricopeptide (TPR) repeat protein